MRALRLLVLLALAACGGGGGDDPPPSSTATLPASGRVSITSPVAAGCTGGVTGTSYVNAEVEPMLARAPGNAQHLVAAWQQDRWNNGAARALVSAVSFDGGASWAHVLHPFSRCGGAAPGSAGDFQRTTDPWVDVGSDGTVHLMGLSLDGAVLATGSRSAMLATRSTDGGRSWSTPQRLVLDGDTLFNDKNTLTVDTLDPRYVYAVWDRLDTAGNGPTLLARSTDAGLSWEPAREIYRPRAVQGGASQTIGNRIVVLSAGPRRGTLVNVFTQIDSIGNNSSNSVKVMRSADRGLTWDSPVTVGDHRAVGARDAATGTAIRDGDIIPSIATGADGSLWVAWQDSRFSGGVLDAIVVSRSTDGGSTWSTPVAASGSPAHTAFTPTLAVRDDGLAGLQYFDLRPNTADTRTLLAAAWLATSRDGQRWAEQAVWPAFDMAAAPVAGGLFLGDYMGMVNVGNDFMPLLVLSGTDTGNRTDAYLFRVTPGAGASAVMPVAAAAVSAEDEARFQARRTAFTRRVMERRVPDWGRRVGLQE